MDSSFDELAKLVGKLLAQRWLKRRNAENQDSAQNVTSDTPSAAREAEPAADDLKAKLTNARSPRKHSTP